MIRKILLLAGVLIALLAAPALAQYRPAFIAPSSAAQGQSFTVSGTGAVAGATVSFYLTSDSGTRVLVGSTTAASDGSFSAVITVPTTISPGSYVLTASGGTLSRTVSIQIVPPSATPPGGGTGTGSDGNGTGSAGAGSGSAGSGTGALPRTGSNNLQPLTIGGALLVATGGLLILATRKQRRDSTVAA